jgi:release factor glutamine methyltransferase
MISGRIEFLGVEIAYGPGALMPRTETELLGLSVIERLAGVAAPRIVDMCCGAGNLACALAFEHDEGRVWACDLTDGAVALARHNAEALKLHPRLTVHQGDLFGALEGEPLDESLDAVVCNPPYISTTRLAERDDLKDEPREAFDGGPYGLSIHQRVIRDAARFLRPRGLIAFEFGIGQARQVELLFGRARAYESFHLVNDRGGEPRVAIARKKA